MKSARKLPYVVYKLTFPNGKIYVGMDIGAGGHSLRYFGSWDTLSVEADFSIDELRDFSVRKQILFESWDAGEVRRMESDWIVKLNASDPSVGYNRTHRRKLKS